MTSTPQQPLTFTDVFDDVDVDEPKEAQTVHHIRANSSIMQLKKILGTYRCRLCELLLRSLRSSIGQELKLTGASFAYLQSPTVVKSVSCPPPWLLEQSANKSPAIRVCPSTDLNHQFVEK